MSGNFLLVDRPVGFCGHYHNERHRIVLSRESTYRRNKRNNAIEKKNLLIGEVMAAVGEIMWAFHHVHGLSVGFLATTLLQRAFSRHHQNNRRTHSGEVSEREEEHDYLTILLIGGAVAEL